MKFKNSHSEYLSRVAAVREKDETLRLCCDYRTLNAKTIPDCHPPPCIQDIIDSLGKNQYFNLMNQTKAYHRQQMDPKSRKCTGDSLNGWIYHLA